MLRGDTAKSRCLLIHSESLDSDRCSSFFGPMTAKPNDTFTGPSGGDLLVAAPGQLHWSATHRAVGQVLHCFRPSHDLGAGVNDSSIRLSALLRFLRARRDGDHPCVLGEDNGFALPAQHPTPMGTRAVLVPESKIIGGNLRLSEPRADQRCASGSRATEPTRTLNERRRHPASHPGGRRFESG